MDPSGVTAAPGAELVAPNSAGPCQEPVYQSSVRRPSAPWKKTSWVEPSAVTAELGADAMEPRKVTGQPVQAVVVQPPLPYQASPRCPSKPRQNTSWVPSLVVVTDGAESRSGEPLVV